MDHRHRFSYLRNHMRPLRGVLTQPQVRSPQSCPSHGPADVLLGRRATIGDSDTPTQHGRVGRTVETAVHRHVTAHRRPATSNTPWLSQRRADPGDRPARPCTVRPLQRTVPGPGPGRERRPGPPTKPREESGLYAASVSNRTAQHPRRRNAPSKEGAFHVKHDRRDGQFDLRPRDPGPIRPGYGSGRRSWRSRW